MAFPPAIATWSWSKYSVPFAFIKPDLGLETYVSPQWGGFVFSNLGSPRGEFEELLGFPVSVGKGMLVIRRAQMDALQAAFDERFVVQLVAHLRCGFPERTRGSNDEALAAHVRSALAEARGYGLTSRQDLTRFLNLTMAGGLAWSTSPAMRWAHEIMLDPRWGDPLDRFHKVSCQSAYRL